MVDLQAIARVFAEIVPYDHAMQKLVTRPVAHEDILPLTQMCTGVDLPIQMYEVLVEREWQYDPSRATDATVVVCALNDHRWFISQIVKALVELGDAIGVDVCTHGVFLHVDSRFSGKQTNVEGAPPQTAVFAAICKWHSNISSMDACARDPADYPGIFICACRHVHFSENRDG